MGRGQLMGVISRAIEAARINFPGYPPGSGAPWPQVYVQSKEARLFAHAALDAIDRAGLALVRKELLQAAPAP